MLNKEELEQIVNITRVAVIGRTVSALETLLNESIECENITAINFTHELLDKISTNNICSVYIRCKGDLYLASLLMLDTNEAKSIASKMIGTDVNTLDELSRSAISELGNILLVGSFINTLANIAEFRIECSAPGFTIEAQRAIIEYVLADYQMDSAVLVYVTLLRKETNSRIHIKLLINVMEAKKLLA